MTAQTVLLAICFGRRTGVNVVVAQGVRKQTRSDSPKIWAELGI